MAAFYSKYPAINVPAPVGGATAANQVLEIAQLTAINSNTSDVATETTLSALNAKVTAVDTDNVTIIASALPTGASTAANQSTIDASINAFSDKSQSSPINQPYDTKVINYVGLTTDVDTIVYKLGGVSGTVVYTQTFNYDGNGRVTSVVTT